MGPTPHKWLPPELDLHLSRERATLAPFPEFRGRPLWFMASIALRGPHQLAPEVAPGASLHSEALWPECGRECLETGNCGPARHVGARRWGLLVPTANRLLGWRHPGPHFSHMAGWGWGWKYRDSRIFGRGALGMCWVSLGCGVSGLFSSIFFLHILKQKANWSRRSTVGWSAYPHSLQVTSPRARPPLVKGGQAN